MKAVFEEINGDWAVFIVDELAKPYFVSVDDLPAGTAKGDVFEVEIEAEETLKILERLPEERERRLRSAQLKREALLKRSQEK